MLCLNRVLSVKEKNMELFIIHKISPAPLASGRSNGSLQKRGNMRSALLYGVVDRTIYTKAGRTKINTIRSIIDI